MHGPTGPKEEKMKTMKKEYLLVGPRSVTRCAAVQTAITLAMWTERAARAAHGPGAGADCHIVERAPDDSLTYRGVVAGRRIIGQSFGCGGGVVARAAEALAAGTVRVRAAKIATAI